MIPRESNQPTVEELELLAEVSQLLTEVDLDSVIQQVIQLAGRVVGAIQTRLALRRGAVVDWGTLLDRQPLSDDPSVQVVWRDLDRGFAGWVKETQQGDIIADTKEDERWAVSADDARNARSALCVPFLLNGEVVAALTLVHDKPQHFKPYHLRLLEIIANQASIAIRNAQLFRQLNEQSRHLETIVQSITDVLLVLDNDGVIEMVNEAALSLLGIHSQEEAIGKPLSAFHEVDDVFEKVVPLIAEKLTVSKVPDAYSRRQQTHYQVTLTRWKEPTTERTGILVTMHNVTSLRDFMRFKDEMLGVVSHDLRSPLALISGYADMIRMDTPDPNSPVHEYVEIIKNSIEKMSNLVEDLLHVERVRTAAVDLQEGVDLSAIVKQVIVNEKPAAQIKNLRFETNLHLDDLPRTAADAVLIRQAMENLINNAIKYTPEGGRITVSAHYSDDKFYFSVEDTGIGIPEEHINFVFEAFYRVEKAKYKEKGSGLGLSLVKNVIDHHNGDVWVDSEEGQGSRFGFWLPLQTT